MKDNLPITNKDKWGVINDNHITIVDNKNMFIEDMHFNKFKTTLDGDKIFEEYTYHGFLHNTGYEGIHIEWNINLFDLK